MRGAQPAPPTPRCVASSIPSFNTACTKRWISSVRPFKIAESNSPALREGARIRQISEDRAKFVIECEDDSAIDVTLADPGASVAVRDKTYQVEYLG